MTVSDAEEDQPTQNSLTRENNINGISIDTSSEANNNQTLTSPSINSSDQVANSGSSSTPLSSRITSRNSFINMNGRSNTDDTQDAASSNGHNDHLSPRHIDNSDISQDNENMIPSRQNFISESEQVNQISDANSNTSNDTQNLTNGDTSISTSDNIRENGCGSESFGMVESMNDSSGNTGRSFIHDRLNYHQNEQEQLSARLRDSLVRRQELMVRYQATRDRLNNLKQQRSAISEEERNILLDAGASESPYEDPIPGAEHWTVLQLENSIEDFGFLRSRVDSLHEAYKAKLHVSDENDVETKNEIQRKIEKVLTKRCQIENAITRMIELLEAKRESQPNDSVTVINSQEDLSDGSIMSRRLIEDDLALSSQEEVLGAEAIPESREELLEKQKHLQEMREQLATMKQLLTVTSSDLNAQTLCPESTDLTSLDNNDEPNMLNNSVVGVNGDIINLSDRERRDPLVVAKFKQLAIAKKRLAKMEEVMNLIAEARDSGKPIHEILSPENLAVLAEAQEDERLEESSQVQSDNSPIVVAIPGNSPTISVTEQPQVVTKQPQVVTECPQVITERLQVVTECPQVVIKRPQVVIEHPQDVTERLEAVIDRPQGVIDHPQGVIDHPQGVIDRPQGVIDCPQGVIDRPQGVIEHPQGVIERPQGVIERPQGVIERPQGVIERPQGVIERPQGVIERPQGVIERPQGVIEHPQGVIGRPQGVIGRPQGVIGHPQGVIGRPQGVIGRPQGVIGRHQGVIGRHQGVIGCHQGVIDHSRALRNGLTEEENIATQQHQKNRNRVPVNEIHDRRTEWERDQEISAMQYRLKKKTTSGISSINDGSRVGREKGAIKKQTRNLFCEGSDPRVTEMLVLQEELKEKKNALEALMKKMGKSSSFALDNFSDNISENVSDLNSETFERPTASWGDARYLSDPSPSDVEVVVDPNEDLNARFEIGAHDTYPSMQACSSSKNKGHFNTIKTPHNPQFSVNNLSDSLPRSIRSKHNRSHGGSIPVTTWENIPENTIRMVPDPNTNKVQNTVFSAMTQLNQVQESINTLYEELRNAERATSMQPSVSGNMFPTGSSSMQPNVGISFANNPQNMMTNYQQLMNSQAGGGLTNPMLAGLQQCYSQLYLHSLEIQSLNKHLQVRSFPNSQSPFFNPFFYPPQPPM